jgi:CRP/FNR family cyclic AMP-dependent transcriptional regulator
VLGGLDQAAERELLRLGRHRYITEGQPLPATLFGPGATSAMLVLEGLVRLTTGTASGSMILLAVRGAGDLLGEYGVLRELRGARYRPPQLPGRWVPGGTALTDISALTFTVDRLCRLLRAHPDALAAIGLSLCERLEEAEARIVAAGTDSAARRLARLLCELEGYGHPAVRPGLVAGTELPIKLSQAGFASWVGTSRGTVERTLRGWRTRGIISVQYRTIVVHDLETLARIADVQVRRRTWNWPQLPGPVDPGPAGLFAMTVPELQTLARSLGIIRVEQMRKPHLIEVILDVYV